MKSTLEEWIAASGQDASGMVADPLFADPDNDDYHLKSLAGRYAADGTWTNDTVHSPFIDLGDPLADASSEPAPNGGRVNLGAYANTSQASKSLTTPWLRALSLNQGTEVRDTVTVRWTWGNLPDTAPVSLEYSADGGGTWTQFAAAAVDAMEAVWDVSELPSTQLGLWRVRWEGGDVWDAADRIFFIRGSAPVSFYVNDAETSGDIYCTAPGDPANTGTAPEYPKASLEGILSQYAVQPGDTVYIDTGSYLLAENINLKGDRLSGTAEAPILIQGSTNREAGGTVLDRQSQAPGDNVVDVPGAGYLTLADLTLRNGHYGVRIADAEGCRVRNVVIEDSAYCGFSVTRGVDCTGSGLKISGCGEIGAFLDEGIRLVNSLLVNNAGEGLRTQQGPILVDNCTIAENGGNAIVIEYSGLVLRNTIVTAKGQGNVCIRKGRAAGYTGDRNAFFAYQNGHLATIAGIGDEGDIYRLRDWQNETGQELFSIVGDPLFASLSAGDYHLVSQVGRVAADGTWTVDPDHSACIDLGDPASEWELEPEPNGARANIGAYGNTEEASKSFTSAWLRAMSPNDGGTLGESEVLRWDGNLLPTGARVRVDYSLDDGGIWETVAAGIPFSDRSATWAIGDLPSTPVGRWRVVLESDESVADVCDTPFTIRGAGSFSFYVNDGATANDLYCTAPGDDDNAGTTPASPKRSPLEILRVYDLEPGDTVYVDAGTYRITENLVFGADSSGTSDMPVTLQGTPNTKLDRAYSVPGAYAVDIRDAEHVSVRDFTIMRAYQGVHLENASHCTVEDIRMSAAGEHGVSLVDSTMNVVTGVDITRAGFSGVHFSNSVENAVANSILRQCGRHGIHIEAGSRAEIVNCALVRNFEVELRIGQNGIAGVVNTIFNATGDGDMCILSEGGHLVSYEGDSNCFFTENGAIVGQYDSVPALGDPGRMAGRDGRRRPQPGGRSAVRGHRPRGFPSPERGAGGDLLVGCRNVEELPGRGQPLHRRGRSGVAVRDREPPWNGGRVNIGAYGNTPEASRSYDTDGDGLSDVSEIHGWGSSPFDRDTDDDTLPDPYEALTLGTHPGKADTDGDGLGDYAELKAGTDPLDPGSVLRIAGCVCIAADQVEITWPSVEGRQYRVMVCDSPRGEFAPVGDALDATPPVNTTSVSLDSRVHNLHRCDPRQVDGSADRAGPSCPPRLRRRPRSRRREDLRTRPPIRRSRGRPRPRTREIDPGFRENGPPRPSSGDRTERALDRFVSFRTYDRRFETTQDWERAGWAGCRRIGVGVAPGRACSRSAGLDCRSDRFACLPSGLLMIVDPAGEPAHRGRRGGGPCRERPSPRVLPRERRQPPGRQGILQQDHASTPQAGHDEEGVGDEAFAAVGRVVAHLAVDDERGRSAAVEVHRFDRAEFDHPPGEVRQVDAHADLLLASVDHDENPRAVGRPADCGRGCLPMVNPSLRPCSCHVSGETGAPSCTSAGMPLTTYSARRRPPRRRRRRGGSPPGTDRRPEGDSAPAMPPTGRPRRRGRRRLPGSSSRRGRRAHRSHGRRRRRPPFRRAWSACCGGRPGCTRRRHDRRVRD